MFAIEHMGVNLAVAGL